MPGDLGKAAVWAVAVHVALLGAGWAHQPARVDVERDLMSLEVELFSVARIPLSKAHEAHVTPSPSQEAWQHEPAMPPTQLPQPSVLAAAHGAETAAMPQARRNRPPAYPWLARLQGREGTVVLRVLVHRDGRVGRLEIERSSGYDDLDGATQRAVRGWWFSPASQHGIQRDSWISVPVRFQLIEGEEHE
jgi:TonB family protein